MRRALSVSTGFLVLVVVLMPAPAVAQGWDPCGDAANGVYPRGYEVVWGGNGGSGNQIVLGSDHAETLKGGPGNDILCGYGGDDTLVGGTGNDWLDGGTGDDVVKGGSGNDSLVNGETNQPGSGNDDQFTIASLSACEQMAVNAGYDLDRFDAVFEGTETFDQFGSLTDGADLACAFGGGAAVDDLSAGDVLFGGDGTEQVWDLSSGGTFYGGGGPDGVSNMYGGIYYGGEEVDAVTFMYGGTFFGGADDDVVDNLLSGDASFDGGDGNDLVRSYNSGICVNVEQGCP